MSLSKELQEKLNRLNEINAQMNIAPMSERDFAVLDIYIGADVLLEQAFDKLPENEEVEEAEEAEEAEEVEATEEVEEVVGLGSHVIDVISTLDGVVIAICHNIDCTTDMLLQPIALEDNKIPEQVWVNEKRLKVI